MISVVIPSFGQAKYLREAISSALIQDDLNDVIVVDDGSNDGSLEIAESFGNKILLIKQKNKGLAAARNAGIMNSEASSKYLFFLDADDVMLPDCFDKIAATIEEYNYPDVICPSIRCIKEDGTVIEDTILMPNPTFDAFKVGNRLAYCCAYKRDALLEVGGYSTRMDALGGYEDLWMHYEMMSRNKRIQTIPERLVMYRIKEKSMITEAKKNHEALWKQIIRDFPEAAPHYRPI